MAFEIETKVLEVNTKALKKKLAELKARKTLDTRLIVDWFRPRGIKEGEEAWFLRIRTNSEGVSEVTWKGKSGILGSSRKHKEVNLNIADPASLTDLFEEIGLEKYAHQEKDRVSWLLAGWKLDLDTYPQMPAYLEIEGRSEEHIQKAIDLLDLKNCETCARGERVLIQTKYGLNWYDMRF